MAIFRMFRVAAVAAMFAVTCGAFALADPPPWAHGGGPHGRHDGGHRDGGPGQASHGPSHGVLSGTIVGVDYGSASILVDTSRGRVPVAVTPTTSIFRGPQFASFSDLGRGAHVEIDFTEIDGRLVAQIIRIR